MFNLTRFWLGTAVYVLAIGGVIAAACVIFSSLIGDPAEEPPSRFVSRPAPVEASKPPDDAKSVQDSKAEPAEIKRAVVAPTVAATPTAAPRKPKANLADVGATARTVVPDIQIIVPEPRSGGHGTSSRSGF